MTHFTLPGLVPVALLVVVGCQPEAPARADAAAEDQAALATDTMQARLWREAAPAAALRMEVVRPDTTMVRPAEREPAPERPATQQPDQPFDASIDAGLAFVDAPVFMTPFSGAARVSAVSGEYLTLDLGEGRTIRLHAKVAGAALRAGTGEQAQLYLTHSGDPTVANDRLALRLPQDELLYALVGDTGLVDVTLPPFRVTARQIEPVENNTAPVRVTVGSEARTLRHGETASFETGNLTVRVLASIAVRGPAANALPGEPYRLHLLGWVTRSQR